MNFSQALKVDFNGANSGPMHPPELAQKGQLKKRHADRMVAEVVYAQPESRPEAARSAAATAGVSSSVQSARDKYRKDRFAGSSILKALILSHAGQHQQPITSGSYSG